MSTESPQIREALIEALSQSPMLRFLGKSASANPELREMLHACEVLHVPAGEVIIVEGDKSDRMYVMASGTVAITVGGTEICTMEEPGEVFGEFGVLTGELRSATVTAVTEVTCLAVGALFTSRLALDEGSVFAQLVQRAMTKVLLGRLRQTSGELARTQDALEKAERQAAFLRIDNEALQTELDSVKSSLREGLRGTRARGDGPS